MLPLRPLRLSRLLVASGAGALVLSGIAAAPASAEPITDGGIQLGGSVNYDTAACTGAVAPAPVSADLASGATLTRSLSFDQTAVATGDETDTLRFKGSQKLVVSSTTSGSQLTSLTATSAVTSSVTAAKADSACLPASGPAGVQNLSGVYAVIHRSTPGWLRIQAVSTGTGGQVLSADVQDTVSYAIQAQVGGFSVRDTSADQLVYVPAGDHEVELTLGGVSATAYGIPSASIKSSIKLTFSPAGVAKAATTGTARSDVTFPSALTCSTGRAAVKLTSAIAGASKVALYVDNTRKTTISRPTARTVTLTGVPKNRAVTLRAVVVDGGRTLSATRSYRAC